MRKPHDPLDDLFAKLDPIIEELGIWLSIFASIGLCCAAAFL